MIEILNAVNTFALPTVAVVIALSFILGRSIKGTLLTCLLVYALISMTILSLSFSPFKFKNLHVNWQGQITLSLVSLLILIWASLKNKSMDIFSLKRIKRNILLCLLAGVTITALGFTFSSPDPADAFNERLLYQMILPGLGEEFVFRGLLLVMIDKHLNKSFAILDKLKLSLGAIISSLPFALAHVFSEDNNSVTILGSIGIGVYTFLASLALAFVFNKTKSIWCCTLSHNTANTVGLIISKLFY